MILIKILRALETLGEKNKEFESLATELSLFIDEMEEAASVTDDMRRFYGDFLKKYNTVLYLNEREANALRLLVSSKKDSPIFSDLRNRLIRARNNTRHRIEEVTGKQLQRSNKRLSQSREKQNNPRLIKTQAKQNSRIRSVK